MLASASTEALSELAMQAAPDTPISPTASKASIVSPATSAIGSFRAKVRLTASPKSLMCAASAACSSASPTTTTLALGGGQSTSALACAWQLEWHSALASQSSLPVQVGG